MSTKIMHYLIRPEVILMAFLRGFYKQEELFGNYPNPFLWKGPDQFDDPQSLTIDLTERSEIVSPINAVLIQEGGAQENLQSTGNNLNYWNFQNNNRHHQGSFFHHLAIHCIAKDKSKAKMLQAFTSRAIIGFRQSIYSLGVDNISPLQMSPPRRFATVQEKSSIQPYDCPIMLQLLMAQQWVVSRVENEIDGTYIENSISFSIYSAIKDLEYDSDGNLISPSVDFYKISF